MAKKLTLKEFRAKHPQYNDLSDTELLDKLHAAKFSDMDKGDFYQRMGIDPASELGMRGADESKNLAQKLIGLAPGAAHLGLEGAKAAGEYGLGAAKGATELPEQLSNLLNKGLMNIPGAQRAIPQGVQQSLLGQANIPEFGEGGAYRAGRPLGRAASMIGMGPAGEAARGGMAAAEIAPRMMEYLAKPAGKAISRVLGMTGYGAATSPKDRLGGAERGALYGAGSEVAPGVLSGIGKGITMLPKKPIAWMLPKESVKQIMGGLEKGQTLEQNSKSLAKDVKYSYKNVRGMSSQNYKNLLDKVGDKDIYTHDMPATGYMSLDPKITSAYPASISKANDSFLNKPTFENAHKLQNTLGTYHASNIKNPNLSLQDRETLKGIKAARGSLVSDMHDYLNKEDTTGNLSEEYSHATQFHKEEAIPYKKSAPIRALAEGEKINPRSITTIFKNPEVNTSKVVGDLGPQAKERIIYNQLGKLGKNPSPDRLLGGIEKLDKDGLGSYVTPRLQDQFDTLKSRVGKRNFMQRVGGVGLGGVGLGMAMHPFGHLFPMAGEIGALGGAGIGALGGAAYGPRFFGRFASKIPGGIEGADLGWKAAEGKSLAETDKYGVKDLYRMLSKSLSANLVRGEQ